jgi:Xaa-Pro aminopeptidase
MLLLLRAAVLLALAVPAVAQEPAVPGNLSRAADGAPTCGLGKEFHAGRRAELARRVASGVVVLLGLPNPRDNRTFRQDKNFWYLTGIESPDVAVVLDVDAGTEVLFLNPASAMLEKWMGELWDAGDAWVTDVTGFTDVRPNRMPTERKSRRTHAELLAYLDELLAGGERDVWTLQTAHVELAGSYDAAGPYDTRRRNDPLDGRASREDALAAHLAARYGREVRNLTDALVDMRLVKQPLEIAALERASRAGALAIAEAVRSTRPGLGEWELDALITWMQQRHGADGIAYEGIVGSGRNSLTLHYNFSARRMRDGEVVLVDFGPEVDHYVSDITRTWPVGGVFSERQAAIYDAVLAAQEAAIAAARPGATIRALDAAAGAVLQEAGFRDLLLHSVSHWIGMEVHDPGDRGRPFEPGFALTVEPGVYDPQHGIGVRIEDVILITEDGCRVLSGDCPRERHALEALVAEQGVLDLVDGAK